MSVTEEILGQLTRGNTLSQLSSRLGTNEQKTGVATAAAVASLLGALAKNASNTEGAAALSGALSRDHDGSILDDLGSYLSGNRQADGDGILGHVFGPKRAAVERGLGKSTGMDGQQIAQLLATVAPLVMAALARSKQQKSMGTQDLAGMLGRERNALEQRQPQAMSALSSLLDTDGDGDVDFGDLASHGTGLFGKFFGQK